MTAAPDSRRPAAAATGPRALPAVVGKLLAPLDTLFNRLYGWKGNPLYQSGTIVVLLLLILLGTGLWLIFFYRIGAPWDSVAQLTADRWTGNWVRGLHRYASDAAVIATVVHLLRMFAQERTWGPRALAWLSGLVLLGVLLVSGWTGFVMVWDTFGHALALEGARWLDALPLLSEPVSRTFLGSRPPPGAFFFMNLFLHVALPLAMGLVLWVHVSRLARPVLLPPRRLAWAVTLLLTAAAVLWPLAIAPEADPLHLSHRIPMDWWYAFWLPATRALPPLVVWGGLLVVGWGMVMVPRLTRRRGVEALPPSVVDRQLCTACRQCALDCPYDAIALVPRGGEDERRAELVAKVNPRLCVSCGICAGSCAPMGVGPAGRTGRAQLADVRGFLRHLGPQEDDPAVSVVACRHAVGGWAPDLEARGAAVHPVDCVGNLHSSVVEFLVRGGARGVLVFSCPPRDCRSREGPKWMLERLYHDREAELKPRVDRARLRVEWATPGSRAEALAALAGFHDEVRRLVPMPVDPDLELEALCEPVPLVREGEPA